MRELDLGEEWRDQHWATRNGPGPRQASLERRGVDQARARGQGVDAERRPGQVEEGERGQHRRPRPGRRPAAARRVRSATSGEPGTA